MRTEGRDFTQGPGKAAGANLCYGPTRRSAQSRRDSRGRDPRRGWVGSSQSHRLKSTGAASCCCSGTQATCSHTHETSAREKQRGLFKCWPPENTGTLVPKPISTPQGRQKFLNGGRGKAKERGRGCGPVGRVLAGPDVRVHGQRSRAGHLVFCQLNSCVWAMGTSQGPGVRLLLRFTQEPKSAAELVKCTENSFPHASFSFERKARSQQQAGFNTC